MNIVCVCVRVRVRARACVCVLAYCEVWLRALQIGTYLLTQMLTWL